MRQYGLSKNKLINIIYKPERKERGIVLGTIAVMKTNPIKGQGYLGKMRKEETSNRVNKSYSTVKSRKIPGEVWLMYKDVKGFRKIISAWRYPGVSKPGENIPIPESIRQELLHVNGFQ